MRWRGGARLWILGTAVYLQCLLGVCRAQEPCYPPGGVAGIVIATIVVTAVVMGLGTSAAWRYRKAKRAVKQRDVDKHKQPSQKATGDFAFDNPYFKDQEGDETDLEKGKTRSSLNKNSLRAFKSSDPNSKGKKSRSGKNNFIFGGGKKHRALDDSCLIVEPERTIVSLRGHDFTGLGFNICGNMRDGILVKDVLHRGPASESGLIKAGDKIISVTVSFTNIVYEDALTILSYASPYDVQLELERIPDKSRAIPTTPSTSKRLGSCSFNNSGQKLFHPLYRSQSIDDLTQIDKDTFPSHGIGPRRSQSVGVAAHKLAAHFKNSDSKLEENAERSVASHILSTTGSLNEKMLANVMGDGALHKNGLQWEKRFEDTLDEDSGSKAMNVKMDKKPSTLKTATAMKQSSSSFDGDASDSSSGPSKKPHNFIKKTQDHRDYPHNKGKLQEFHPPHINGDDSKEGDASKTTALVHQSDKNTRAKTLAEASHALWHLDQSIKDSETAISDLETSVSCPWEKSEKEDNPEHYKKTKSNSKRSVPERQDAGNESDASAGDSDHASKKHDSRRARQKEAYRRQHQKQYLNEKTATLEIKGYAQESENLNSSYSPHHQMTRKNEKSQIEQNLDKDQLGDKYTKNGFSQNAERVYANSLHEKKQNQSSSSSHSYAKERDLKSRLGLDRNNEYCEHQSVVYANQREMHDKANSSQYAEEHFSASNKLNGRVLYSESNLENSMSGSRNSVNGENEVYGSRYVSNSKCGYPQKNPPLSFQKQMQKSDSKSDNDLKVTDSKSKTKSNSKEVKQSTKPAGTFTQINPFQQPAKQKNALFKPWSKKEDKHSELPPNGNDIHYFSMPANNSHITTSDSSNPRINRDNSSELHSYASRSGDDISKTVLITSYDSNNSRSFANIHNMKNSHLRQMHK